MKHSATETLPEAGYSRWLFRYALLTAVATLALIAIGGVVTSRGAGMAVPDWPTTYGYNMFFFPFSYWMGGIFYEHSHRLIATVVGLLVVGLTRWLGGSPSRLPLAIVGALELGVGLALVQLGPEWKGAGHFLAGIGGVVLLAAAVWVRNRPAARPLPLLGWIAFFGVQIQGLLGGLRVVLFRDELGIFHAALAQLFFVLICAIALRLSWWWKRQEARADRKANWEKYRGLRLLFLGTTALIFAQLVIGAMMRHQHAGLAIPDFPLAYGKVWPDMDAESVMRYNQQRLEMTAAKPITAFQIGLQMTHRLVAFAILGAVLGSAWLARRKAGPTPVTRMAYGWAGLILVQVLLGAWTIWSNKAADIATAHVTVGALSLALGGIMSIVSFQNYGFTPQPVPSLAPDPGLDRGSFGARPSNATGAST